MQQVKIFPAFFQDWPEARVRLNDIYYGWSSTTGRLGGLVLDELI